MTEELTFEEPSELLEIPKNQQKTDLFSLVSSRNEEELIERIQQENNVELLDARNSDGATLLQLCSLTGLNNVVKHLLSCSVDLSLQIPQNGKTALHCACISGDLLSVHYLIQAGANIEEADNFGNTPLMSAAENGNTTIIYYLSQMSVSVNQKNLSSFSALHFAAYKGQVDSIRLLNSLGANLNGQDNNGNTPIHLAIEQDEFKAVQTLAQIGANFNVSNNNKFTPFQYAQRLGKTKMIFFVFTHKYIKKTQEFPISLPKSPAVLSFSLSLYILGLIAHFTSIFLTNYKSHVFKCAIFILTGFGTVYLYIKVVKSDPGIITKTKFDLIGLVNEQAETKDKKRLENIEICMTCLIRKPLRSKHDVSRNQCVARYDHLSTSLFFHHWLVIDFLKFKTENEAIKSTITSAIVWWYQNEPFLLFVTILGVLMVLYIVYLLYHQFNLIGKNLTTNEKINHSRYPHFQKNGKFHNPFTCGSFFNNFIQFFDLKYPVDWFRIECLDDLKN
ncbi:palmitoyltransferase hip14 [Anaeramoeba flamelloides]|uniref:Palmitoyltransferase hip14 n=1 Tax=Anaeramoeba flamelloides TaxID=1746091 RepID=A0AAV7YEZ6_9EUKA|nr:palmitoyltransferase hip14 [Anaeramoeba flamelloides]